MNEKRFAEAYVTGKFRMKKWGKYKMRYGLRNHRIDEDLVEQSLSLIDEDEYLSVLKTLIEKKNNSLKEGNKLIRKKKILDFVVNKGYESSLANNLINEIL